MAMVRKVHFDLYTGILVHANQNVRKQAFIFQLLTIYSVPCTFSPRLHLSYLWKTWPSGQAFSCHFGAVDGAD